MCGRAARSARGAGVVSTGGIRCARSSSQVQVEMDVVPHPACLALFRREGFVIIRRVHAVTCRRHSGGCSPTQFSLYPKERLERDATQRLPRRNIPQPGRGRGSVDGGEQSTPILATDESIRPARLFAIRKPIIFDAVFVARSPALLPLLREPLRGCDCQHIQRRPKGFPTTSTRLSDRI